MINSRKITTIRFFLLLALLILVFDYSYAIARGGGRGGGGGGRSVSRSGPARSGSMNSNRSRQASSRSNREVSQQRTSTGRYDSRGDRQQYASDRQSNRKDYAGDRQSNRQDYASDRQSSRQEYGNKARDERQEYAERYSYNRYGHHHYEHWGSGGAFAAGLVVGTSLSLAAFNSGYPSGCATTYVGNTAYYHCGTTWYQKAYSQGNVTYIVVNPPN